MGSAAKKGGRPSGRSGKRELVIDAAVEVFLSQGFDRTTMDTVAARAGVSKATVYAHYKDKLGLFHAVVERAGRAFEIEIEPDDPRAADPEQALRDLIVRVLGATTDPTALSLVRILTIEGARRPELSRVLDVSLWDRLIGFAVSLLEEDAASNGYELSDPRTYALQLLRMASASLTLDCLLAPEFAPDRKLLESHAEWVVALFLRGIRPRSVGGGVSAAPAPDYPYRWLPGGPGPSD